MCYLFGGSSGGVGGGDPEDPAAPTTGFGGIDHGTVEGLVPKRTLLLVPTSGATDIHRGRHMHCSMTFDVTICVEDQDIIVCIFLYIV